MAAQTLMSLTTVEREAITDSVLKLQSIEASLRQVEKAKLPFLQEIFECLRDAHVRLRAALTAVPARKRR